MVPRNRRWLGGPALLLLTLCAIIAADRLLLARLGLPIWQADPVLQYRHRPGAFDFNRWGLRNEELPLAKPAGERRIAVIGDSVVMGHGVAMRQALPAQLEAALAAGRAAGAVRVLNAGVQGYWTEQYPEVLRRLLAFGPDAVVLGICMNDVAEFYGFDARHGGTGLDYHGVQQVPWRWLSYLVNETGFGRLAVKWRWQRVTVEWAQRRAAFAVHRLARDDGSDPELAAGWRRAFDDLDRFYDVAAAAHLPLVVVLFPYDFQIGQPALQEPQRRFARHAAARGVTVLDSTPVVEQGVGGGATLRELLMDDSHLTPRGAALVGAALAPFFADPSRPPPPPDPR